MQREARRWEEVDAYGETADGWSVAPYLSGHCSGKTGTITVHIENTGTAPIASGLTFLAIISGPGGGSTTAPADAFIRLRVLP